MNSISAVCQHRSSPKGRTDSQEGRWRAQEESIDDWLPINARRNAKWWYSAFHNVTAMVGAGVLSLPYAMSELGWSVPLPTLYLPRYKKKKGIIYLVQLFPMQSQRTMP